MNTSYLVNIVANDFKDGSYIFEPFLLDQKNGVVANGVHGFVNGVKSLTNGVVGVVNGGVNGIVNGH